MDDPLDEDMPGDSGPSADRVKAAMGPHDVLKWGDDGLPSPNWDTHIHH
jgi:hypothetical protein